MNRPDVIRYLMSPEANKQKRFSLQGRSLQLAQSYIEQLESRVKELEGSKGDDAETGKGDDVSE